MIFGFGKKKDEPRPAPDAASAASAAITSSAPENPKENANTGWFGRLRDGLSKTRKKLNEGFDRIAGKYVSIDTAFYTELEETLVSGDIGVSAAGTLLEKLKTRVRDRLAKTPADAILLLEELLAESIVLDNHPKPVLPPKDSGKPYVILIVGVNGSGKTTSIGKIAAYYANNGYSVLLGAADTFRAAAIEQLEIWAGRAGADFVRHKAGSDPSAVAFDALKAAQSRNRQIVLVDTAGRLQTKSNLMEELKKIRRVMDKALPGAPDETLLVLDSTTGQNGLSQARLFHEAVNLDGIILTKLDGTAKGGVVVQIIEEMKVPVKFIGVGEKVDDLREFDPKLFAQAVFSRS